MIKKLTHNNFYVRSDFPDRVPGVAVDAGSRPVNEGDGNVGSDLVDPLQHGSLGPAVRNGHVLKGRLSAETQKNR